jgi:uncharacterized protein YjiS (DUF1127 family)
MGARVEHQDGATINTLNAYHAAFLAVGRLLAQPFRFLRQDQQNPDPKPNSVFTRNETMTKSTQSPLAQWARTVRDSVVAPLVTWYRRQQMMEELNGLSDRVLADIGLTRAGIPAAVRQAYRPIWSAAVVPAETATLRTAVETRPAASNDEAKQSLAA